MMVTIDKLLTDIRKAKLLKAEEKKKASIRTPPKREMPSRLPDAVVLIHFVCRCKRCGNVHKYPNKYLLLRYGREILRPTKKFIYAFSDVPRETLWRDETLEACEACFEKGIFPIWEKKDG